MRRLKQYIMPKPIQQSGVSVSSPAYDQARGFLVNRFKIKTPGSACDLWLAVVTDSAEHYRLLRLDDDDRQRWGLWMKPYDITRSEALPFGNDPIRVMHIAPDHVFQPRVAIKSAPRLSDLHQPRPDC